RLDAESALRREPVDLTVVVRDCIADALAIQPGRRTTLHAPDTCVVTGDRDALHQVMTNLLANVRAHTPPDAEIFVDVTVMDGAARVSVRDTGPGMAPELVHRAFDRFARTGNGGSGLGLAIVAGIVGAHGGEVGIDSEPGRGTAVTFAVPLA